MIEEFLLFLINKLEFNFFIKSISFVFLLGFVIFLIFYFKRLKDHITSWDQMDSFDKLVFISLIGIILIVPVILLTLLLFFMGTIIYEFFNPYICGNMMNYLGIIFFCLILIYLIYISFKLKFKKIDSKILVELLSFWRPLRYLLWIDLILLILVLVLGVITPCIGFG